MRAALLLLGEIVKPWGRAGEVKLSSYGDLREILRGREGLYLQKGEAVEFWPLEGFRLHQSAVLLKFKGCQDVESAERLRGCKAGIPRETAPELAPDAYYHYDIIGLTVIDGEETAGKIVDIWTTGANDVYVVERGGKEWLLPATKEAIRQIDLEKGILQLNPLEGLRDLEEV